MDFVHDRLADGRPFRLLTLVDNFSRVNPAVECDFSLNGQRVVAVLERLKAMDLPQTIKVIPAASSSPRRSTLERIAWREARVQPAESELVSLPR